MYKRLSAISIASQFGWIDLRSKGALQVSVCWKISGARPRIFFNYAPLFAKISIANFEKM